MGSICSLLCCCRRRSSDEKSKTMAKPKRPKREVRPPKDYIQVSRCLSTKDIQLQVCVANGDYADVYRAVTPKGKLVAIKVINLRKIEGNYTTSFLPNEIKVLRKCKHNNIIKVYEISHTEKWVLKVMEWAPYGTLADWLRDKGALTETQAVPIFIPILDAMHHMHTNRIAHRDLKLENILITDNHVPKISDFSYAVEYQKNEPKTTTFCGSDPYFSPEILQRQPFDPIISDIWSLGVCYYIALNDGVPFRLGDDPLMLQKQLTRDWRWRPKVEPNLSKELKDMVTKMLEPDTSARVTTEALINHKWVTTGRTAIE